MYLEDKNDFILFSDGNKWLRVNNNNNNNNKDN